MIEEFWAPYDGAGEPLGRTVGREEPMAEVRRLWPNVGAQELTPIGDGWTCDTYEVDGRWIVQFPRTAYAEEAMLKQRRVLPVLARRLPAPIPSPVPASDPDAAATLYWKIDGAAFTEQPEAGWPEQLGILLRELQAISPSLLGLQDRSADELRQQRSRQLDVFSKQVLPLLGREEREQLQQLFSEHIREETLWEFEPVLAHNDLGPAHILVNESGKLAGVIDWEELAAGDPAVDFAWMLGEYPEIGRRMLDAACIERDAGFHKRARFNYLLMPFHEVIYGQVSGQPEFIESGLHGIRSRLFKYQEERSG